jgi:Flp pilus assembly pilin Flp
MFAKIRFRYRLRQFWRNKSGATATEYAFVIAFISIVSAFGMVAMGNSLSSFYGTIGGAISNMGCEMPVTAADKGKENSNRCK